MFLRYWNNPTATTDKFVEGPQGKWMLTGDQGYKDPEGYFLFRGRDDDIIKTSGYRVGPGEVENCLLRHPAVSMCAVIGKPDQTRGELVKAFIVLRPNFSMLFTCCLVASCSSVLSSPVLILFFFFQCLQRNLRQKFKNLSSKIWQNMNILANLSLSIRFR
jgi:acyl-CoA synthetase (AMP-forming)/AMP-acid ligase II